MTHLVEETSRQSISTSPTPNYSTENVDKVVQSVTNATKRLSQISTNTNSSAKKRKTQNRIGPWKLGRTLGRGSTGRVRLAKNVHTGQLAAIKIVPKSNFKKLENPKYKRESIIDAKSGKERLPYGIEREIIIMKLISHPNIMGLYDVWENKNDLYLILEYIEGGELFDYLIKKGRLQEFEAISYFKQIIHGISYLHQFNICHRDLKPENLLLDFNKRIKIADFGMAALEVGDRLLETSCGSPHYASPEIVAGKNYHGAPSDIWSCGIILFALLTGHLPFDDENIRKLLLKVQNGKFLMPSNLSPEAKDLISKMLKVDPAERIGINEILKHPLLTRYPEPPISKDQLINVKQLNVKPLDSVNAVDKEILKNLSVLFHNRDELSIVKHLLSPSECPEKLFYHLLVKYRSEHVSSVDDDDCDMTGSDSKQTIPRSTSIVKTITVDHNTGEKHTTIRKVPASTSNKSLKVQKRRNNVLGNITNTAPTFKASTSFNRKKTLLNNTPISSRSSSKSLKKRPPQQQPPKLTRKLTGLSLLADAVEKENTKQVRNKRLSGAFGNKSLANFESICQEILGDQEQVNEKTNADSIPSTRRENQDIPPLQVKDSVTNSRQKKIPAMVRRERELAAKVRAANEARDRKFRLDEQERLRKQQLQQEEQKALEIHRKNVLRCVPKNEATQKVYSSQDKSSKRYFTDPVYVPSLDPKLNKLSLMRAKSLAYSPGTSKPVERHENTNKVLHKLGIEVQTLKPSHGIERSSKVASSKTLCKLLETEEDPTPPSTSLIEDKENFFVEDLIQEKNSKSKRKSSLSKSSTRTSLASRLSNSADMKQSAGYKYMLGNIDETKTQKNIPPRPVNDGIADITAMSVNTTRKSLIPNPRFSRFSFNALLNSDFDNPDVTITNNLSSKGSVLKKSQKMTELSDIESKGNTPVGAPALPQSSYQTGKLKKSSTRNLIGLGIGTQEKNVESRKVSNNTSSHMASNFTSVGITDSDGENSHHNTTLQKDAIDIDDNASERTTLHNMDNEENEHKSLSTINNTTGVFGSNLSNFDVLSASIADVGKLNKSKPSFIDNLDSSRDTITVGSKYDETDNTIESMYKDYANLCKSKEDHSVIDEHNARAERSELKKSNERGSQLDYSKSERVKSQAFESSTINDELSNFEKYRSSSILGNNQSKDNYVEEQAQNNSEEEEVEEEEEEEKFEDDSRSVRQNSNQFCLKKSSPSTQIFNSMIMPPVEGHKDDKDTIMHEETKENQDPNEYGQKVSHESSKDRMGSIFRRMSLKPKREAPKAPVTDWKEEKDKGHNRFSRISVASKFDRFGRPQANDNLEGRKGNWFTKFINALSANTKSSKSDKTKHELDLSRGGGGGSAAAGDKLREIQNKNVLVFDSKLPVHELTRLMRNTLEMKKVEGSVTKVEIDEEFGVMSGVIPAKFSGGRKLRFRIEIVNLVDTSSMHLTKLKGTDKGFKNLSNIIKFIINQEESSKMESFA